MEEKPNLIWAIGERNLDRINEFINLGVNVNDFFHRNVSPLVYTLLTMDSSETGIIDELLSRLIEAGADVNSICKHNGMTATMLAMVNNRSDELVLRFINAGTDVSLSCTNGKTSLTYAITGNCGVTVIRALIKRGSDVNMGPEAQSPLYRAVIIRNDPDIIKTLLEAKAEIKPDEFYKPFLALCCKEKCKIDENCKYKRVTDILIKRGVNIKERDDEDNTIIHQATCNYVFSLAKNQGISVDEINQYGYTPLFQSLFGVESGKVNDLLLISADPNWRDSSGNGYLHFSNQIQIEPLINLLVYHGADLLAINKAGHTPVDFIFKDSNHVFGTHSLGVASFIRHYALYINEEGLYEIRSTNKGELKLLCLVCMSMNQSELQVMRNTFLKADLSIYQFCHLKRFYNSRCIPIEIDEYLIDHDTISENFTCYHQIILMRLRDNSRKNFKQRLLKKLEYVFVKAVTSADGDDESFLLQYHCLYDTCKHYLNYRHLYALIAASFNH